MKLINVWRHFRTITKHWNLVRKHCFKIGLYWQGLTHDLSKYSPEEFWTGVRFYQGDRSPNAAEREEKDERNQMLRGIAAHRVMLATTPIFIIQWVILLAMDVSIAVMVVVMLAYLAHFLIYMYQLVRLQKEL